MNICDLCGKKQNGWLIIVKPVSFKSSWESKEPWGKTWIGYKVGCKGWKENIIAIERSHRSGGVHTQTCAAEMTGEGEGKGESER